MEEPLIGDMEIELALNLMSTPRKWTPIFHREGAINVMHLVDVASFPNLPWHRKSLLTIFLLVVRDRGTEIRFEPRRFEKEECLNQADPLGFRMIYVVAGHDYELVPPPQCLSRPIAHEIEAVADLNGMRHRVADGLRRLANRIDRQERMPRQGRFRIRLSAIDLDVQVKVYPSELGERYVVRFASPSDFASAAATKELRRLSNVSLQ